MVDDSIENSELSNKTKNKNNFNLFILKLVLPEIYYRLTLIYMVLQFIIETVILINSWGNLCLKKDKWKK